MKKLLFLLTVLFTVGANAQTTLNGNVSAANGKVYITAANGNINTQGQINVGVGAKTILAANGDIINVGTTQSQNFQTKGGKVFINGTNGNIVTTGVINANGKATIDASNGSIWASGTTTAQGGLKVFNGASIVGGLDMQNGKITKVANGTAASDAVNKGQLDAVQTNLNTQVERLDARIDATNQNVAANANAINNLQSTKADKVQVAMDIEDAKRDAVRKSNDYTDEKVSSLNSKVDTEVSRLDGRIDATNTTVSNLTTTVEANKVEAAKATAKVQSNLDAESAARKKADEEIYGSISKTNANLDKEIATRKLEVARLDTRIDGLVTYVGNEFRLVNNRMEGLGAMTAALSAAATSSIYNASKPTNLNIATGFYGRASALAVGVSHFFSSNTKVSVNWSQGSATKSAIGIGAGFSF